LSAIDYFDIKAKKKVLKMELMELKEDKFIYLGEGKDKIKDNYKQKS